MKAVHTLAVLSLALTLASCGDSPTTPTGPAASTQERVEKDLKAAGEKIKDAAGDVARDVDPALQRAKEEAKTVIHTTADKIAEATAPTQPAPATQP